MDTVKRIGRVFNSRTSSEGRAGASGPRMVSGPMPGQTDPDECRIPLATYVESRFVPDHVMRKTRAGRVHYQALLKHILSPELVADMFARYGLERRNRLRAIPGWPYLDHTELRDVNADHVRDLIECASAQGYSPQTTKHIKNVIGAIISHAQNDGLFKGKNPASKVKLQRTVHRTPRNITLQQAKAIIRLLDGTEKEIALLSLTTGMSAFEICKLQWKHVNLSAAPVMCEREMIPPRCILIRREPASTDVALANIPPTKTIDIPDGLFRRLLRIRRLQQHTPPEGFVLGARGTIAPFTSDVSRATLVHVGRELGIPWLSWQVLKRGHQALIAELRDQVSRSLVASAR